MSEERGDNTADLEKEKQSANIDQSAESDKSADLTVKEQQHSEDSAASSVSGKVISDDEEVKRATERGDSAVKNADSTTEGCSSLEQDSRPSKEEDSKPSKEEGSRPSKEEGSRPSKEEGSKPSKEEGSRLSKEEGSRLSEKEGSRPSEEKSSRLSEEEGSRPSEEKGSRPSEEKGRRPSEEKGSRLSKEEGRRSSEEKGSSLPQADDKSHGDHNREMPTKEEEKGSRPSEEKGIRLSKEEGSRLSEKEGSRPSKEEGSRLSKEEGSRLSKVEGSRPRKEEGSRMSEEEGSRMSEEEGRRMSKEEGSRMSEEEGRRSSEEKGSSLPQADDKSHGDHNREMPTKEEEENTITEAISGEEKASETTTSPSLDKIKEDQVDGPKTSPNEESSTTNDTNGDVNQDGENVSDEEEDTQANATSAQMPLLKNMSAEDEFKERRNVETIGPATQEANKHTVVEETGNARGSTRYLIAVAIVVFVAILVQHLLQPESPPQKHDEQQIDVFLKQMEKVKTQFPNQRDELWNRCRIHLKRHLQTSQPTEPVSLILTSGLRAERTLQCLARALASAFSSALNASVLHIDGSSKADQDSDQVKLDIDEKLQNAFEGDKPVAVIHRFEELPPGSTLIFYRYCDHENAAYKKTFLIFTVLLGEEEEIPAQVRLSTVEEMVDDHLQKKFLSHGHPVSFDKMDLDKYGGLWSRISHLILPVAAEKKIEHKGC
ncbi:torsin-1A-interacting protein 2-like [Mugil cephalus]|uniref:torsin-1A-interacting protein 2-like n=1 Tax=Mugil cephalus TaxID=48193 RepID=UPI001FB791C6|nr:torsin-1A-interacting protein 2-like [Mugil cephalus]XP_047443315.1 torsin-1A-interacting protein 2-like [Mugil cephalus]